MRIFLTGASGFVGSAMIPELIGAGHQVLGLARSDASAAAIEAAGATVHRGSLQDVESLMNGAAEADGVIHTGFIHDFDTFLENCVIDERAIEAMGSVLAGSERPLLVTSGLANLAQGRPATEDDGHSADFPRKSEAAAEALAEGGVRAAAVRLAPSTHGRGDHGFVPMLIGIARRKGVSAYVGDGANRWSTVHRVDAARLYRLAIEKGAQGGPYHAIGDEGVAFKDIATVIGRRLDVPVVSIPAEQAAEHFGFIGRFTGTDLAATAKRTRKLLGWEPKERGLIADLNQPYYFGD